MGIKTNLKKEDISHRFACKTLQKTTYGVSDTVYILDKKYVLKLFESASVQEVMAEIRLLDTMCALLVPTIKRYFILDAKPVLIYEKAKGKSLQRPKKKHIRQIGEFLKKFHSQSKGKKSSHKNLFSKKYLQKLIDKTKKKKFQKVFLSLNHISLPNDGIIHGDLFRDNALFYKNQLSCVLDWIESCQGCFYFDLAVVAVDWCMDKKQCKALLGSYQATLSYNEFISYIDYALLYYSVVRYLDNRKYKPLLKRISTKGKK